MVKRRNLMNRGKEIKLMIYETEEKIEALYVKRGRGNPIDADLELSLKAMGYIKIKEIMQREE
jgi:hypothetical protein